MLSLIHIFTASIMITVKVPDEPTINKTTGFRRLRSRSVKQTKTSVTLQWNIIKDADGYFIYGNRCNTGTKSYKYRKLATITGGDISTRTQKDLKKGTYYKYVVKAYRLVNGKKVVTDTSISVHAVTGGGKYGNAKAVSVTQIGNKRNVSKITLKMGKTAQIKAKEVKKDKKIERHRKLCYESSNTKVATVTPEDVYKRQQLWQQIKNVLRNPVIRRFILREDIKFEKKAGLSALCEYSLLSDNVYPIYAVTKKELKDSGVKAEKQVSELEEIGCVVLELGYFIDFLGKGFQDPLSVVLSLTGDEQEEERVDISINEMLEEYVWSKD